MTLFDPIVWDTLQVHLGIHENEWLDPERVTIRARSWMPQDKKWKWISLIWLICVFFVYFGWFKIHSTRHVHVCPFSAMTTPWLSGGITALPAVPRTVAGAIPCYCQRGGHGGSDSMLGAGCVLTGIILVNYSDLTRGRPKWWFSKGLQFGQIITLPETNIGP